MKKRDAVLVQVVIGLLGLGYVVGATYIVSSYESEIALGNNTANQVLASDTDASSLTNPVISNISLGSGVVGSIVKISGSNLAGFEGSFDTYIENKKGERGFLEGRLATSSGEGEFEVVIPPRVCKENTTFSGLPCSAYLTMGPGIYHIYVEPWGVRSNQMTFTLIK